MIANHWFVRKYGFETISEKILSIMIIRAVWLIDRFRDFGFLRNIWTGWGIQLKITKEVLRSFLWNWDHVSEEFEVKSGISQKTRLTEIGHFSEHTPMDWTRLKTASN